MDQVWLESEVVFFIYFCIFINKQPNMTLVIILLVVAAVATFILMKKGKIADKDGNNIPDVIEDAVKEVKEEVKEVAKKAKKATTKKKATKE